MVSKNRNVSESALILYEPYSKALKVSSFLIGAGICQGFSFINLSNQDTAHNFQKQDFTASFSLTLMLCAMVATIALQRFFPKTKHSYKAVASTISRIVAFFVIFISFKIENLELGFWVCIGAVGLLGSFTSIYHTVFVGLLKNYPRYCYSSYSTGSGFSGLTSIVLYMSGKFLGISIGKMAFLLIFPNIVILGLFFWMLNVRSKIQQDIQLLDMGKDPEAYQDADDDEEEHDTEYESGHESRS